MNCIINDTIQHYLNRGKKVDVIKRYIRMKYKISIDLTSLNERIRQSGKKYEVKSTSINSL